MCKGIYFYEDYSLNNIDYGVVKISHNILKTDKCTKDLKLF